MLAPFALCPRSPDDRSGRGILFTSLARPRTYSTDQTLCEPKVIYQKKLIGQLKQ